MKQYKVKPVKNHRNLNTPEHVAEMVSALRDEEKRLRENPDDMHVSISAGNRKMGAIPSVSLLPIVTCPAICSGTCGKDCYALKTAIVYPSARKAWARNTAIALHMPERFFSEIDEYMQNSREFRFHVSGDIPNVSYFDNVVSLCRKNPHCAVLMFTKRFSFINKWISENGNLPDNLHVLFSGWEGLQPDNPNRLPETDIIPIGTEPEPDAIVCGGNCSNCRCHNTGCWSLSSGNKLYFYLH